MRPQSPKDGTPVLTYFSGWPEHQEQPVTDSLTSVGNSSFTPSSPDRDLAFTPSYGSMRSQNSVINTQYGLMTTPNSSVNSLAPLVEQDPEQTPAPLEFRQVSDVEPKKKSRSRLRRFIDHLFHPRKYLALRKAEKMLENIKVMLADPEVFMEEGSYAALNKELLSDFAQFIAVSKNLQPKQNLDGAKNDYTTLCRALGTLLMENTPVEMLLDETLTEGWRTELPAFAEFAKDYRLRAAPCIGLTAKFTKTMQLNPGKLLSECVPDWSTRFDEKAITAMVNAPAWLTPRLEAELSEAKQRLQDMAKNPIATNLGSRHSLIHGIKTLEYTTPNITEIRSMSQGMADEQKALEEIKDILAVPELLVVGSRHDRFNTLNRALQDGVKKFIAAGGQLPREPDHAGPPESLTPVSDYAMLSDELATLLVEKPPMGLLLNKTLTEGWRTLLPSFADFAQVFRQHIEPCNRLIAEFNATARRHPDAFLSDSIPDWSKRFDAMTATVMKDAPPWLLHRLWTDLSAEQQRLKAMANSILTHF